MVLLTSIGSHGARRFKGSHGSNSSNGSDVSNVLILMNASLFYASLRQSCSPSLCPIQQFKNKKQKS
jgi:hypothetical protein